MGIGQSCVTIWKVVKASRSLLGFSLFVALVGILDAFSLICVSSEKSALQSERAVAESGALFFLVARHRQFSVSTSLSFRAPRGFLALHSSSLLIL